MTKGLLRLAICSFLIAVSCGINPDVLTLAEEGPAPESTQPKVASDSLAETLGIEFLGNSTSTLIVQRDGKRYLVDLVARTIRETPTQQGASVSELKENTEPRSALLATQQEGPALFKANCATCHGADGTGLASLKTPDFTSPKVQAGISDEQMRDIIKNGKAGTMMPAFGAKLSVGEINAVQAFVRSLGPGNKPNAAPSQQAGKKLKRKIYTPGDDVLFILPTGRPLDRHGLYVNFAHRFPFFATFSDQASGGALFGFDSFAIPSFGLRYGVTDRLSVGVYREPSIIGRPIQLMASYNLLEEQKGNPLNLDVAVAMQGQNDFLKNYTESIEGIFSRSFTSRAQLYLVPTFSLNNRQLQTVGTFFSHDILDLPGHNTFSLGIGGSLDIRPTVALVAEVIPTLASGRSVGILRPAYSFGIQKKIWRHAFTFGFTTAPGTTVAERAATRASLLAQPNADTFGGLFIGFDVTRQLF